MVRRGRLALSLPARGGIWRQVAGAAGAKVLVMGVTGVLGFVTTKIILKNYTEADYAQYGLLSNFTNLLPFADLGIGAAVLNAVGASRDIRDDEHAQRTITTAVRVLCVSAVLIAGMALALLALGWWRVVLGDGLLSGGDVTAAVCMIIYAAVLPLTVGQRIVVGIGRTSTQVLSQGVVAPAFFLAVVVLVLMHADAGPQLSIYSFLANTLVTFICVVVAWRATSPTLRRALRDVPRVRAVRGARVIDVAWPQLVQSLLIPIAFQMDRILISHISSTSALAQYNLAAQLFGLVLQIVIVAGVSLWPHYAKQRAENIVSSPLKPALAFGILGGSLAFGLALVSPWLVDFVSHGKIELDSWILFGFIAYCAATAAKQPLGMYMTDPRGMRRQIPPVLVMVPLNLWLAWLLIDRIGPGGPKVAGAVSTVVCQIIPYAWFVRRDVRRRRAELAESSSEEP